ncbi:Hypothetical protein FKW44_005241, partial [Caligus rogercresseyi]
FRVRPGVLLMGPNFSSISNLEDSTPISLRHRSCLDPSGKTEAASHHKAIEYSLLSIKSLIAKKLTNHSYIKIEDLRAIMIGTAARYCAMAIKFQRLCIFVDMCW